MACMHYAEKKKHTNSKNLLPNKTNLTETTDNVYNNYKKKKKYHILLCGWNINDKTRS